MSGDLLALGAKYVALTEEIEDVRRAMLACLTNGAGEHPTRPPQPARRGSGGSQPNHPKAILAAQAEEKIIELLRSTPGLGMTQIAKETGSKTNPVVQRLQRLRDRGVIERLDGSGWTVSAAP